jgi:hypothetical protein
VKKSDIRVGSQQSDSRKIYHRLGTSPYGMNLTLLNVLSKGFPHRLARTKCLHSLLDSDIQRRRVYET